jgi:general secretion pathway protein G
MADRPSTLAQLESGAHGRVARRGGFTLIEVLIVVVILGILASLVIPRFVESDQLTRETIMASTVRYVRQMVQYHRHSGTVALAASGFPQDIEAAWFRGNVLPEHSWTGMPMVIADVDGDVADFFPAAKTCDPNAVGAASAWYNRTNGAFCVLVAARETDDETLAAFNAANSAQLESLAQTTH